ncbi:MAG: hypothetical protein GF383_11455 [Candidatus Lokiarchaeota archaeon]|nr:hypothetical protein [Candidatus Lokiarchaeota archaeon]MBD3341340.1 hypothetical protein [Candidatus Lokiarchaeota archaeon]
MTPKAKSDNITFSLDQHELSENEQFVLDVIQEYLDKNRYFNESKIKPIVLSRVSKSSININKEGIKLILKSLVEKNFIVNGSKLVKEDILKNSNRKKIYSYILEHPGTYFNKVVEKFNLSNSVVEWHISMLSKFGFIRREKINSHEVYFSKEISKAKGKIIHLILREKCDQILKYLERNNNGHTKTYLCKELKMHPKTIKKYLKRLIDHNVLYSNTQKNRTLYFLNYDYYQELKQA